MQRENKNTNKKKMVADMILNVSAAAIPVAMLQLIIYPLVSRYLSENEYGLMITMYSLWLLVSNTLGNAIFNVRLIKNNLYEDKRLSGDFLVILLHYFVVNLVCNYVITIYYNGGIELRHLLFSLVISSVLFLKSYLDVGFRLIINFKAVTISGSLVGMGFLIGSWVAVKTGLWEMIFLTGYMLGCIYAILKTKLLKEKFEKTVFYKETQKDCLKLTGASIIGHLMTYADKLILFPIMGGRVTAIYYNATLLAKVVGMITGPSSGVILTYLSKKRGSDEKSFKKMLLLGVLVVSIGYLCVLLVSRPIMTFLYPNWVNDIMTYIPITTINVSLLALVSILNPFVLKYCDLKWQMVISGTSAIVYFLLALVLWRAFGLMGFCWGTVIGSCTRLTLIIYTYHLKVKK